MPPGKTEGRLHTHNFGDAGKKQDGRMIEDSASGAPTGFRAGDLAGAERADEAARRIRLTIVWLIGVVALLWVTAIGYWIYDTREGVAKETRGRLVSGTLKAALSTQELLHDVRLLLERASQGDAHDVDQILRSHEIPGSWGSGLEIHLIAIDDRGRHAEPEHDRDLPPAEILTELLARAGENGEPILSRPYQADGRWFAAAMAPAPLAGRPEPRFLVASFALAPFRRWWSAMGDVSGFSAVLLNSDGELWWRDASEAVRVGEPSALRGLVAAFDLDQGAAEIVEVPKLDGRPGYCMLTGHDLGTFGLRLIGIMPSSEIGAMWRERYLSTLPLFFVFGLVVLFAIAWGGWRLLQETQTRERALSAAEESERRLRDIADAASDWFWEMGPDLRFTYLSDRIHEVSGVKPETFIGRSRLEFLVRTDDPAALEAHQRDLQARRAFRNFVYSQDIGDGRLRWVQTSGKPIFDRSGRFMGYRGTGTDITAARTAEQRLAAAQLRLSRAIENSPNAFALFDERQRLVSANRRFQEWLFPSEPQVVRAGMAYEELFLTFAASGQSQDGQKDPEGWLRNRIARQGAGKSFVEPLSGGRWLRSEEYKTPEGELICVYSDITAFKQREAELIRLADENMRLAAAVGATQAGVVITDPSLPDNPVIFVNPAFTRITGYEAEEVMGRNCRFLHGPGTDSRVIDKLRDRLQEGEPAQVELLNYRKDGSRFWNRLGVSPVLNDDGSVRFFVGIQADITEQKRTERDLMAAKESAELAYRSKSEFLAVMSHELRTPLNAIIGFSDILKGELFGPVGDPRYCDYARDIHESGSHLLALINDILDLSKGEAGKLELYEEGFSLEEVVEGCVLMVRTRAEASGLSLEVEIPEKLPQVHGDERKIKQVVLNLFSNAIKFSEPGGVVGLKAELVADGLRVIVSDSGIGMDPKDIPRAFEPFEQVESAISKQHAGTGLGLPLSKRFVELHGGTMEIESQTGVGTSVSFILPRSRLMRDAA